MKFYRTIFITVLILLPALIVSLTPAYAQTPTPPPSPSTHTLTFIEEHRDTLLIEITTSLVVLVIGAILGTIGTILFKPSIERWTERRRLRLAEQAQKQQEKKATVKRRIVDDAHLQTYLDRVAAEYNHTRVLGQPDHIPLDEIFTDIYILDQPEAFRRFDITQTQVNQERLHQDAKRVAGLEFLRRPEARRLFILGKPGAGKTTFLRYLTCQAARGRLQAQIPILLTLCEWAENPTDLLRFIAQQFEQFGFPEPRAYITHLLEDTDNALVLFDGLDEVSEETGQREKVVKMIRDFTRRYPRAHSVVTCRVAATDYTLEGFTYAEVADFTDDQVRVYARKWFRTDPRKKDAFLNELEKATHRGLRELARTPLLLGLLCLNFDATLAFPARRVSLYTEALEALLNKWDASRCIKRDTLYGGLDTPRKHQLFATLAYHAFVQGHYLFEQPALARAVAEYVQRLPAGEKTAIIMDGDAILRDIEAQHGILVERAHRIYAFAHLTFQEYYTARYVAETPTPQALTDLMAHITEERWREVFLLTASMFGNADAFFIAFLHALDDLVYVDSHLVDSIAWADHKAAAVKAPYRPAATRAYYSYLALDLNLALDRALDLAFILAHDYDRAPVRDLALDRARDRVRVLALDLARALDLDRALDRALNLDLNRSRALDLALDRARTRARELGLETLHTCLHALTCPSQNAPYTIWTTFIEQLQAIIIQHRNLVHEWASTREQIELLERYLIAACLLVECLDVAYVTDRAAIEDRLLLPPKAKDTQ